MNSEVLYLNSHCDSENGLLFFPFSLLQCCKTFLMNTVTFFLIPGTWSFSRWCNIIFIWNSLYLSFESLYLDKGKRKMPKIIIILQNIIFIIWKHITATNQIIVSSWSLELVLMWAIHQISDVSQALAYGSKPSMNYDEPTWTNSVPRF